MGIPQNLISIFWLQVDKTPGFGPRGDCWVWTGSRMKRDYGRFQFEGRKILAARLSFELATGETFPEGLLALHHCDNPPCVNPAHIYAGTHKDNAADMIRRGRYMREQQPYAVPAAKPQRERRQPT